ncbi:hypothetical protein E2I00_019854, partial [Balaenoptera physalus]
MLLKLQAALNLRLWDRSEGSRGMERWQPRVLPMAGQDQGARKASPPQNSLAREEAQLTGTEGKRHQQLWNSVLTSAGTEKGFIAPYQTRRRSGAPPLSRSSRASSFHLRLRGLSPGQDSAGPLPPEPGPARVRSCPRLERGIRKNRVHTPAPETPLPFAV